MHKKPHQRLVVFGSRVFLAIILVPTMLATHCYRAVKADHRLFVTVL
jgi:hypothetical protein